MRCPSVTLGPDGISTYSDPRQTPRRVLTFASDKVITPLLLEFYECDCVYGGLWMLFCARGRDRQAFLRHAVSSLLLKVVRTNLFVCLCVHHMSNPEMQETYLCT